MDENLDIELSHKRKSKTRKSQLATGYESDSDGQIYGDDSENSDNSDNSENEEEKKEHDLKKESSKNADAEEEEEEEDDDMFASDNEEVDVPETQESTKNTKNKNVLDIEEFEKEQGLQDYEFNEELDGAISSGRNSPNNGEKEEVKLEAFNLREEVESGKFDKDMNYIPQEKDDSEEDEEPWMGDATAEDIRKARKAQQQQKQKQKQSEVDKPISVRLVLEILMDLILELEPAETPMEALSRLLPAKKTRDRKLKTVDDPARKQSVYNITEFCEQLVNEKGITSVYDMSREELMREYRNETGEDFQARGIKRNADEMEPEHNDYGEAIWEFRWVGENEVNGPYSTYEMKYWKESYFDNNVEVRKVNDLIYKHVSDVSFEEQ